MRPLLFILLLPLVKSEEYLCEINACEALEQSKIDLQEFIDSLEENNNNSYLLRLERRLRALEQPVWKISKLNERWIECAQGPCKCRPETKSLSCWQQNLPVLPATQILPQDTVSIVNLNVSFSDLGINGLTTLNKNAFLMLSYLSELDLFDNKLDHLPDSIFDDLHSLQYLRLHKNKIEDIPDDLLLKLRNLQTLDMSNNKIRQLPPHFFRGNPKIIVLHMSRNIIKILPQTLFNNLELLEDLDLSNNKIERLPKFLFTDLKNLKRLQLAENRIDYLPSALFDTLINLEYLNLRRNHVSSISEKLFYALSNLKSLQLTSNHLRRVAIQINDFRNLINLEELHLGQNFISELAEDSFESNTNLKKLYLFSNNLEELKEKSFNGLNNLTTLLINNNILKSIDQDIFAYIPNLEKLLMIFCFRDLDSNKFHFLPSKCLDYLKKLISIKLAKNPWHCDCSILYLAGWVDENNNKVWDIQPTCRSPANLGGSLLKDMGFNDLCKGQWASMMNLSPRVPIRHVTVQPPPTTSNPEQNNSN
ncbi:leucine-rich repeat-containing protein 15 [Asbolus verrucosus]|uniref:Leucine-rich repeat-containing protein 15 n=1 Tax=Asbolus verrucosus TaxID=1661398 RepID=A0A482W2L9_ASBVE|nr:leucine-rich repeat-containing protein 15 [Asbolus verrucosus]